MERNHKNNLAFSQSLDLPSILRAVFRKLFLVLLVSIVAAQVVYIVRLKSYTPQYQTSVTFIVSTRGRVSTASSNIATTSKMATVFSEILGSSNLADLVAADLGTEDMPGEITSAVIPDTNLLTMSVTAASPQMAYDITCSVMENYRSISDYIYNNAVMEVLAKPKMPSAPVSASDAGGYAKKAGILVFLFLNAIVIFLSYMNDSVKNEHQVKEKLDLEHLISVVDEGRYSIKKWYRRIVKKEKTSLLVNRVDNSFYFTESFKTLRSLVEYRCGKKRAKRGGRKRGYVIMITSVAENEGKSTVAANLALTLAQKHEKVLLIDGDMRKPAQFKILMEREEPEVSFYTLLVKKMDWRKADWFMKKENLHTILDSKSHISSTEVLRSDYTKQFFDQLREELDYIIIDTSPVSQVADAEILAEYADEIILVVREDLVSAAEINDVSALLDQGTGKLSGCVFNRVSPSFMKNRMGYGHYAKRYGYGRKYGYGYGYGYGNSSHKQMVKEGSKNR